jgi:hypothetical protein
MSDYVEGLQREYHRTENSFREAYDLMQYWTAETERRNKIVSAALRALQDAREAQVRYLPPGVDPCRWGHNTFLTCPPETCRCLIETTLEKQRGEHAD